MSSGTIAVVVLAAGASRRLGRPKQTVLLDGETLIERAARTAKEAGLGPVIVVLNPTGDFGHSLQEEGFLIVLNDDAAEGMASSIRYGIRTAMVLKASGVVLMTCDQPGVDAEHLRALCERPESSAGSGYAGKVGVPAYFPAACFEELLQLKGDTGARNLLRGARAVIDEELGLDVDREADVRGGQKLLEKAARKKGSRETV